MQIKTKIVSSHTAISKPVKQEVNSTVILPPLVSSKGQLNRLCAQTTIEKTIINYCRVFECFGRSFSLLPGPSLSQTQKLALFGIFTSSSLSLSMSLSLSVSLSPSLSIYMAIIHSTQRYLDQSSACTS